MAFTAPVPPGHGKETVAFFQVFFFFFFSHFALAQTSSPYEGVCL